MGEQKAGVEDSAKCSLGESGAILQDGDREGYVDCIQALSFLNLSIHKTS